MEQDIISQTTLDQMVGSDSTQMLKAVIPYLPLPLQEVFSIYAKARELSNTMALFSSSNVAMQMQNERMEPANPLEILNDVRKVCSSQTRHKMDGIANMLAMVQMMQIMNDSPDDPE